MKAGLIYSGQYRATYSVLLPAQSKVEAERVFTRWLEEKGERVEHAHMIVRRTYKSDRRPVILP